jgi:hypothetical protein
VLYAEYGTEKLIALGDYYVRMTETTGKASSQEIARRLLLILDKVTADEMRNQVRYI